MEKLSQPTKVLLIVFPGFNTLDMNGPYDVFSKSGISENFVITVAAETDITKSVEGLLVQRNIPLDDDLVATAAGLYDILVITGGGVEEVYSQAAKIDSPFMRLIAAFAGSPPRSQSSTPWLISICTGAFFPAALGIFDGQYCTTHWASYADLVTHIQNTPVKTQGPPGTVIAARFVDAGVNKTGVRILSSGGISCGIDASLHVVKTLYGVEEARSVAELLDYAWRQTDGVIFGQTFPVPSM